MTYDECDVVDSPAVNVKTYCGWVFVCKGHWFTKKRHVCMLFLKFFFSLQYFLSFYINCQFAINCYSLVKHTICLVFGFVLWSFSHCQQVALCFRYALSVRFGRPVNHSLVWLDLCFQCHCPIHWRTLTYATTLMKDGLTEEIVEKVLWSFNPILSIFSQLNLLHIQTNEHLPFERCLCLRQMAMSKHNIFFAHACIILKKTNMMEILTDIDHCLLAV